MRADICDTDDEKTVQRFRNVLIKMGARLEEKDWCIGVDVYRVCIGDQELTIFSDAWCIDIEGPESLVSKVLENLKTEK